MLTGDRAECVTKAERVYILEREGGEKGKAGEERKDR